jgi:hypothetical protein
MQGRESVARRGRLEINDLNDVVGHEGCSSTQERNFVSIARGDDAEIRLVFDGRIAFEPADCDPFARQLLGGVLVPRRDLGRSSAVKPWDVRLDEERAQVCLGHRPTVRQTLGPHV